MTSETKPRTFSTFLAEVFIPVALIIGVCYVGHRWYSDREIKQAAQAEAAAMAGPKIQELFKTWTKRSLAKDDSVLEWSGASSKILWMQHIPAQTSMLISRADEWTVWAETPNGRVLQLSYRMQDDGSYKPADFSWSVGRATLLENMKWAGELERAKEFGVPFNPA